MNARILIIEGTSGVGKSTLLEALLREYIGSNKKIRSLLSLSQAHTYGPVALHEDTPRLTKATNKNHLDGIYEKLEWFAVSLKNENKVKFFGIIDTLHLTQCVRPGILSWEDVKDYDVQLKEIGCKLLFIKASPETIWERGIVPRLEEQFMTEYAKKFGNTTEKIHQYFVDEQVRLERLAENSCLEKLFINAEDDFKENTARAYRFWLK